MTVWTRTARGRLESSRGRWRAAVMGAVSLALGLAVAGCGSSTSAAKDALTAQPTQTGTTSAALGSPSASPTGSSAPAGPASCATADLRVALGTPDSATSHVYIPLRFTNAGSAPCTLTGFAGVSYVTGESGAQVGAAARRDGPAGSTVTLTPGGSAAATIGVTTPGPYDPATCVATTVPGFRVYPPDERQAAFVPDTLSVCSNASLETLTITAVRAG